MFLSLFLSLILAFRFTIFLAASPLILGVWIISISLWIAIFISFSLTSWLGLIIFIIYVGGLLVMFAYFVALTPNLLIEGTTIVVSSFTSFICFFGFFSLSFTPTLIKFSSISNFPLHYLLSLNAFTIIVLALVLFLALVAVVKLCSNFSAPLRPFTFYVNFSSQISPPN